MSLKFEGIFDSLSDPQLKLIESVIQKQGYESGKVVVEPIGPKGDHFSAKLVRIIYESSDGSTFKMVGKAAPSAAERRIMMQSKHMFSNEITIYQEVMPKMDDLQESTGVPLNDRIRFPTCYGTVTEEPHEFILLEDLKESNFGLVDKIKPLSNDTVRLVLKDLATFHSLSFVLKKTEPETYEKFTNKLLNLWLTTHDNTLNYFEGIEADMKLIVDNEKQKQVLNGSISRTREHAMNLSSYESSSKYSVIQQGDCWSSNIMFRLQDGIPVQNVMVDYQVSKEGNPAEDILYFIFNCTDHETRMEHYYEWIDYYHEMLDKSLNHYGMKSNLIYPRDQLDSDLKRYAKFAIGLAIMVMFIVIKAVKEVVDVKDEEGANGAENLINAVTKIKSANLNKTSFTILKQRVVGLTESAIEFGLV